MKAVHQLESYLEKLLQMADYEWALAARHRMSEEVDRIHSYYGHLLKTLEAEQKDEMEAQYVRRQQEIEWQYRAACRRSSDELRMVSPARRQTS